MKTDDIIKLAAPHYSITSDGELSRDSSPFKNKYKKAKLGVKFDSLNKNVGYYMFHHRQSRDIQTVKIYSHRLIFYIVNGYLPKEIDHIDRDSTNNHPNNLRAASHSQNMKNVSSHKGSTSKHLGVCWDNSRGKWVARIRNGDRNVFIGRFKNEEDAAKAFNREAIKRDPHFANINNLQTK